MQENKFSQTGKEGLQVIVINGYITIENKILFSENFINIQVYQLKIVMNIRFIRTFKNPKKQGGCPKYTVFEELSEYNFNADETDAILRILKSKSIVCEPQKGRLKLG